MPKLARIPVDEMDETLSASPLSGGSDTAVIAARYNVINGGPILHDFTHGTGITLLKTLLEYFCVMRIYKRLAIRLDNVFF